MRIASELTIRRHTPTRKAYALAGLKKQINYQDDLSPKYKKYYRAFQENKLTRTVEMELALYERQHKLREKGLVVLTAESSIDGELEI